MQEFSFLKSVQKRLSYPDSVVVGIGDDCSVVKKDETTYSLSTSDLLVGDVHFFQEHWDFFDVGHKSLAVSLSDIAAMGGVPLYASLSLALPKDVQEQDLQRFYDGFLKLASEHGVSLVGGDTTRSPKHWVVNVTLYGEVHTSHLKTRAGFVEGCQIYAIGNLGHSALGFEALRKSINKSSPDSSSLNSDFKVVTAADNAFLKAHLRPEPLVKVGQWLGRQPEVAGLMDISDGLLPSLHQLKTFYDQGCRIELASLPEDAEFSREARAFQKTARAFQLWGGEDYGLLVGVSSDSSKAFEEKFRKNFSHQMTHFGEIKSGGVECFQDGAFVELQDMSFRHF